MPVISRSCPVHREAALREASQAYLFKKLERGIVVEQKFPYVFDNYDRAKTSAGEFRVDSSVFCKVDVLCVLGVVFALLGDASLIK